MVNQTKLNQLSDDELFDRLKEQEPKKTWTIGEVYEIERRGFDFLDRDPAPKREIESTRDAHRETVKRGAEHVRNQLLPFQNSLISTASLIERVNLSLGISKVPQDSYIGHNSIYADSLIGLTGPVRREVSNLEINQKGSDDRLLEATLEKAMKPFFNETKLIRKLLSRDPIFWIIAGSTFFSAVATIWMLVLTIQSQK